METCLKRPTEPGTSGDETKTNKKRLYDENFLKFGFTVIENKRQCVICFEPLLWESVKVSTLLRHLNTKHPNEKNKPWSGLERKLKLFNIKNLP